MVAKPNRTFYNIRSLFLYTYLNSVKNEVPVFAPVCYRKRKGSELFVKKKQPYEPNPERHQVYLEQYQKFKTIRQLIADVFK